MQKKGSLMQETPVRLFFIFASGFIVLAAVYFLIAAANEDAEMRICKASLTLQSSTDFGALRDSPLNTECKRRYLEIRENALIKVREKGIDATIPVWLNGKPEPTYKSTKLPEEDENTIAEEDVVHSILAESMRRCWDIGLEGERSIFDEDFTGKNICLICDQIDVQVAGSYVHDTSFTDYLAATNMPLEEQPRTYEDYMFTPKIIELPLRNNLRTGDRDCIAEFGLDENPVIQRGTYATILFKHHSAVNPIEDGCMATYVVPASKARTLCEQTVN